MLVPQGVAYAALAGMPLVTGIYASLIPALVAVYKAEGYNYAPYLFEGIE